MVLARGTAPDAGKAATDKAKEARRAELDEAVGALLRELQIRYLRGTVSLHDPVLALARTHVAQAVTMGAGARYQAAFDALLGAIAAEQSSRTPQRDGAGLPAISKTYDSFDW